MSNNNNETLLRVENLCMYFKMGKRELKAVDNVSFDIKKGEVFGLVGESGCGKTTTGRSIIKIYDVTGGDVYFKGQRICAGTRSYTDAIKVARKDAKDRIIALKDDTKLNPANAEENKNKINEIKAGLNAVIKENKVKIASARNDQKNVDKEYAAKLCEKVKAEYAEKFKAAEGNPELMKELEEKIKNKIENGEVAEDDSFDIDSGDFDIDALNLD
jgi:oligopeptide transport system ATP-binding protein